MGLESMFGRREKWKDGDKWGIAGRILEHLVGEKNGGNGLGRGFQYQTR